MASLFTLRSFASNLLRRNRQRNVFFYSYFVLIPDLEYERVNYCRLTVVNKNSYRMCEKKYVKILLLKFWNEDHIFHIVFSMQIFFWPTVNVACSFPTLSAMLFNQSTNYYCGNISINKSYNQFWLMPSLWFHFCI